MTMKEKFFPVDGSTAKLINSLLKQLSEKAKNRSKEELERVINQPNVGFAQVFFSGFIVGIASIHFKETLIRKTGVIEDVIVDNNFRGQGFGKKLMKILIKDAKKRGAECVELTSNSKRKEANAMYESMGFKKRETNCYRLEL